MSVIEILWCLSTMLCVISVMGMLYIYRLMQQSMDILSTVLSELIIKQGVVCYDSRVQGVAKNTEMAK